MKRSSAATIAAASSGVGAGPVFRDVTFLKEEGWVRAVIKIVRHGRY
jgi:hypothetical protein